MSCSGSTTRDQKIAWRSKGATKDMEETNHQNCHKIRKKSTMPRSKQYELVSYHELPEYMKDNEYILHHYRANWPIKVAFFSLFRWHNETLNVWTHLIGFVLFLWLATSNLTQLPQLADLLNGNSRSVDPVTNGTGAFISLPAAEMLSMSTSLPAAASRWPFFVYLGGSMVCLLSSSTCHLFCCHSHRLNLLLLRLDYAGIAVMIVTSFFPAIYYIFQCNPIWQFIYLAGITTMGVFTVGTLLSPALSTKEFRPYRAMLFFLMGFSGILPAIHALIANWTEPRRFIALAYEAAMALSYGIGTLFYVTRIPERWRPGWFDLAGHSHQIFHIFVVMGALAHYGASLVYIGEDSIGCESRNTIMSQIRDVIYISSDEEEDEDEDLGESFRRLFSIYTCTHTQTHTVDKTKKFQFRDEKVDFLYEEDDDCEVLDLDECRVLDGDPDKPVQVGDHESVSGSDELLLVAEKGQIACRDYPHARHLCVTFPFNTSPHEKYCDQCHCYVCDAEAPCVTWGTGKSVSDHCHATEEEGIWRMQRTSSKQLKVAQIPVCDQHTTTLSNEPSMHPVVNPPHLWWQ